MTGDSGVDRWHSFRSNRIDAVVIDADHRYQASYSFSYIVTVLAFW